MMIEPEEKIKNFIEGLKVQLSKLRAKEAFFREHKLIREADYIETKRSVAATICDELESQMSPHKDGYPNTMDIESL